jgi:hypothetical protein
MRCRQMDYKNLWFGPLTPSTEDDNSEYARDWQVAWETAAGTGL